MHRRRMVGMGWRGLRGVVGFESGRLSMGGGAGVGSWLSCWLRSFQRVHFLSTRMVDNVLWPQAIDSSDSAALHYDLTIHSKSQLSPDRAKGSPNISPRRAATKYPQVRESNITISPIRMSCCIYPGSIIVHFLDRRLSTGM